MEELSEAKNGFLASISHEIRTPLTAIVGFSQVLEDGEEMTDDDRDLIVASIVQQAREMSDLVEDLLVAARAESGQISVDLIRIDAIEQVCLTLDAGGSFTDDVRFDTASERIDRRSGTSAPDPAQPPDQRRALRRTQRAGNRRPG